MSITRIEFPVPTEALPALIGHQGQKHRDTEKATATTVRFNKKSEVISTALVFGTPENCCRAKCLINIAVGHHLASLKTVHANKEKMPSSSVVLQDLRTVCHEIYKNMSG